MKYNIFIVAGPLHLMNAIEAIEYFKSKNNILIVLYTDNKQQLSQIKKLLNFVNWHTVEYIRIPQNIIDKLFFVNNIDSSLQTIQKDKIDKLFVGEYRSDHVNHIVNMLSNKDIYLLDDGLAQLNYHNEMNSQPYRVKVRRVIYQALFYKLERINYTFFTIFDIKNEKIIKNNYNFFKKYIRDKQVEDSVYFIGQPLVELGIMSEENYKKSLSKIIDFYKGRKFIYILHRREKVENIKELSLKLNFEYKLFDNLIELEMIMSKIVPSDFATFYSTAIVTLPRFISEIEYRVFRTKDNIIHKNFIDNILNTYQELEKIGLRVVQL